MEIKHRWTGTVLHTTPGDTLQGADLQGADLQDAYLQGAYLQGADLRGAYLQGADLRGAYLQDAYLQGADLQGADLQDAYLQGALYAENEPLTRYLCIGPIGSRSDYLQVFCTPTRVMLHTGCFAGTIDEFQAAVTDTHDGNPHGADYRAAITFIRALTAEGS